MKSDAYLSEDRQYRYWLVRIWDERLPVMAIFGVNPSTADERENDQTIMKDIGFAARNGFGGILKMNIGAYRATDPRDWRRAPDPIGPLNTPKHLREYAEQFNVTMYVAAWGKNGKYAVKECDAIREEFPELMCFGCNSDGTPRHPLMLSYSTPLEPFAPQIATC